MTATHLDLDELDSIIHCSVMKGEQNGRNQAIDVITGPERGADKSKINLFVPEYFRVAVPTGLVRNTEKGGETKGPIR